MVKLHDLVAYLDALLQPYAFKDYCPNGLQVQGKTSINTLVTGVSANQALIEAAIVQGADALLVHHGLFWKNEPLTLTGIKYHRVKSLVLKDVSLIAYHLPLDAHLVYGNNIQLANHLGLNFLEAFAVEPGLDLGFIGCLDQAISADQFTELLTTRLARPPLHIPAFAKDIHKIAWCTGAAQDFLTQAIEFGVDAYVTGEVSERTVHIAKENNIHFFAAGHHATERYGVKALGEHLSEQFNLQHVFIDIDNPV